MEKLRVPTTLQRSMHMTMLGQHWTAGVARPLLLQLRLSSWDPNAPESGPLGGKQSGKSEMDSQPWAGLCRSGEGNVGLSFPTCKLGMRQSPW